MCEAAAFIVFCMCVTAVNNPAQPDYGWFVTAHVIAVNSALDDGTKLPESGEKLRMMDCKTVL